MDRIKEKIRERVLQQVPTGVDVDEKYLADAIDRVITEIGQEQYMRFGERRRCAAKFLIQCESWMCCRN